MNRSTRPRLLKVECPPSPPLAWTRFSIPIFTVLIVLLAVKSSEGSYGVGIGSRVRCFGSCSAGQVCTEFIGHIKGFRQDYCKCVVTTPPPPTPPPPGGTGVGLFLVDLNSGDLTLSGTFDTTDDFPTDPIIGAGISLSGPLSLDGIEVQTNGDNLALFLPGAPLTLSVGTFLTGQVTSVAYVGNGTTGSFSVTVENLVQGTSQSDYVDALLAGPQLLGWGIGFDTATDVSPLITSGGSFNDSTSGTIQGVVPEPATIALLALGGLMLARRRRQTRSVR